MARPTQDSLLAFLARQGIKSVCCREHLKTIISYWLTQASLRLPPLHTSPLPLGSDPSLTDIELGPHAVGRLLGELAVHRESFSRVWSGSPESLECILDALITIGAENKSHALEVQLFEPALSAHKLSLQPGAGRV